MFRQDYPFPSRFDKFFQNFVVKTAFGMKAAEMIAGNRNELDKNSLVDVVTREWEQYKYSK